MVRIAPAYVTRVLFWSKLAAPRYAEVPTPSNISESLAKEAGSVYGLDEAGTIADGVRRERERGRKDGDAQ